MKLYYDPEVYDQFVKVTPKRQTITYTYDRENCVKRTDLKRGDIVVGLVNFNTKYAGQIVERLDKKCRVILWHAEYPLHNKRGTIITTDLCIAAPAVFDENKACPNYRVYNYRIDDNLFPEFPPLEELSPEQLAEVVQLIKEREDIAREESERLTCEECITKLHDFGSSGYCMIPAGNKIIRYSDDSHQDGHVIVSIEIVLVRDSTNEWKSNVKKYHPELVLDSFKSSKYQMLCETNLTGPCGDGKQLVDEAIVQHQRLFQDYIREQLNKFQGIKSKSAFKKRFSQVYPGKQARLRYLNNNTKAQDCEFLLSMWSDTVRESMPWKYSY